MILILTLFSVLLSLKKFRDEEFECAVCLEPCTDTLVNPECNHRFCGKCIKESLHKCNHECPTCRVPIPTYRTCRRDPQFDHIVSTVLRRNYIQHVVVCEISSLAARLQMEILEREKRNEARALAEASSLHATEESRLAAEAELVHVRNTQI